LLELKVLDLEILDLSRSHDLNTLSTSSKGALHTNSRTRVRTLSRTSLHTLKYKSSRTHVCKRSGSHHGEHARIHLRTHSRMYGRILSLILSFFDADDFRRFDASGFSSGLGFQFGSNRFHEDSSVITYAIDLYYIPQRYISIRIFYSISKI